jgi:subtilisin-like proprotein convertase family protein
MTKSGGIMRTVTRYRQRLAYRPLLLGLVAFVIAGLVFMGLRSAAKVSASQKGGSGARANIQVLLDGAKSINLGSSGNLGVAVLGSAVLDVNMVDPASLSFAGAGVMKKKGANVPPTPDSSGDRIGKRPVTLDVAYRDVNKDGYNDLVANFAIPFLSQLSAGTQEAFLHGRTYGGAAIEGSQFVSASGARQRRGGKIIGGVPGICNTNAITINDNAVASPYPSTINVTGQTGVISDITVSLTGFNHTFAQDVSVLLVGPTGQKMILFAQVSDGSAAEAVDLTFDDAAPGYLPIDTAIESGTYKPTNRAGQNIFGEANFPAPAPQSTPASPYAATLSGFLGTNPNGTWSLYVVDNAAGDSGSIDGGWCLNITTSPSVTTCAATLLQGSIAAGDTTQTGRLFRDGTPSECVGTAKVCPGNSGSSTLRYDTYTLTNNNTSPACVTVTTTSTCGINIFASAYLTSYTPPPPSTNLCTNYLGDAGLSPQASNGVGQSFSVTVPAGATLVLVANEVAANTPCASYSLLVEGNVCAPVVGNCTLTCPANITTSNDPNQCGAVVNYPAPTTTGSCGTVTCTPASGSFFPKGTTTVICSATGGSTAPSVSAPTGGAECSFTVTVNDTQPPTITCPTNVTGVTPVPGGSGSVVTYPPPTASDNCPGVTAACVPPSGSTFPVGTSSVTCTATDSTGNTATCSFTVTMFNVSLQDESAGCNSTLLFNSVTGDYRFCCNGTVFTGKGKVVVQGSIITLSVTGTDRRIQATADGGSKKGNASLQSPVGTTRCTIRDDNITNNTCLCGTVVVAAAPQKP